MGYCLSVSLDSKAPVPTILNFLKTNEILAENGSIYISDNPNEHTYAVHHNNGIYLSYSRLSNLESSFVYSVFKLVVSLYGIPVKNPLDNNDCPCIYYDREHTLILSEEEMTRIKGNSLEVYTYNDKIITANKAEKLSEKTDEAEFIKSFKYYVFMSSSNKKVDISSRAYAPQTAEFLKLFEQEDKLISKMEQILKDFEDSLKTN